MASIYDEDYNPGQEDEEEKQEQKHDVKLAEEYAEDFEDLEDKAQKKGLIENRKEIKEEKEEQETDFDDDANPLVRKFENLFDKYYKTKLEKLIQEYPAKRSFTVDFTLIEQYDPGLADQLIDNPEYVIESMQIAARKYKSSLIEDTKETEFDPIIRIANLPKDKRLLIKNISSRHIGKFIGIEGIVKQFTTVMPKIKVARWICKKCGQEVNLHQEGLDIKKPKMCPECKHRDFILDEKNSEFQDYQKLEVQELLEELKGGEQSSTIQIYVYGDLVNTFTAGERLIVSGILKLRTPQDLKNTVFGQYILCSSIESSKQDYESIEISKEDEARIKEFSKNPDIYNLLMDSIAPHINGHLEIKEAIALQLFGGVRKTLQQKSKIRGNIHVLIVGDPGTGKSQHLLAAAQIAPKSIYIAGKTASGAGLCVGKDSLVIKDSKLIKIKDLIEEQLKSGYTLDEDNNLIAKSKNKEYTKCLDLNNNKVVDSKILNYVKIPVNKDLIKIIDENGLELITTQNTPILIDNKGKKEYIKAKELKLGQNLVSMKKIKITPKNIDLVDFLDFNNTKIKLTKTKVAEIVKQINLKYKDKRTFGKEAKIDENILYFGLNHRGLKYNKLEKILKLLNLKLTSKNIEYVFNSHGKTIKIPKITEEFMYLFGLVLGDGDISYSKERGVIRISNSDLNILNKARKIISSLFGKEIKVEYQKDKVSTIRFNSKVIADLFYKFGYTTPKVNMTISPELTSLSNKYIANLLKGIFDTDGYVVNRTTHGSNYIGLSSISKDFIYVVNLLLKRFGIVSHISLKHRAGKINYINNKAVKSNYDQYELIIYSKENHEPFNKYIGFDSKSKQVSLNEIIKKNTKKYSRNNDDIYLSKIVSIINCKDKYVYDFTIQNYHNFFANGFLVHNTATAVKDEFGEGGWTLKAGALVLANGGFAMIDEFDKMDAEDRSAMHEALEQETVSIAKAGIVTAFKTETSVLAAANPKYGRFDAYKTIPEQIDIPPTLMSRFDLFFVIQDIVDEKKDTETVNAILRTQKSGELIHKGTAENLSERESSTLEKITTTAAIDSEFLKKYIAYGRTRVFPVLTENAIKIIQKFFIGLRQKSQGGRVTVTFRQLEALVRLSEASAKIRLSESVGEEDANRAISLYKRSMEQVGLDPETGTFDIDIIATGQSHNQTSRMMKIVEIINNIVKDQNGQPAKYDTIVSEAEKEGLDKPKVKELIEKLLKVGDIYEPRAYCYLATKKD